MTIKKISLKSLSINERLGLKDYSLLHLKDFVYLKNILVDNDIVNGIKSGRTPSKFNEQYWYGEYEFLTMQDVDKSVFILNSECLEKITEFAIEEEKTLFKATKGDLIFSNAMTVGLAFEIDRDVYLNQNIFALKVDNSKYSKTFLKWYFNLVFKPNFNKVHTSKYISKEEVSKIKVPKIAIEIQNELAKKIQPIETEITHLKNSKQKPLDIINKVFGEEFGFDWEEFEKLSREKIYKIKFSQIKNTTDFRTATKFHSIKYDFLKLPIFNQHKFKDFAEFMTLGRQIQPEQFEEETDYYYLMPNAIKTNSLNDDLMKEIKLSFFDNLKHIALKYNDLVLAASGEGTIGKSAIYNSDKDAITSQFIMKIELKDKSLVEYFHYYMQSSYFLLTVEKFKKGMGNMTNIFVSQVKDFPILYDEAKQTEIVEKIKSQIDSQNLIDVQIEQKQQEINAIIENAIKTE